MLENLDIFVLTCDKSIHCCDIFQKVYTYTKHPTSKVYFLGYKKPEFKLLDNFYFISLNSVDPGPKCTTHINNFFKSYNKSHFILTVDDLIPVVQNNTLSNKIYSFIFNEKDVGRYALSHDVSLNTQTTFYKNYDEIDYVKVTVNSLYKLSLVWSIWNKDFFLKNLIDNQDLWEFETIQNEKCKLDKFNVYGTKHYNDSFIDFSHLYKKGNFKKNSYMYRTYSKQLIDDSYKKIIDDALNL